MRHPELVFDWNREGWSSPPSVEINDETIRDGLQSATVLDPTLDQKRELLDLMAGIGVRAASLGLPATGQQAFDDVVALARHVRDARLELEINCAARTLVRDIEPIVEAVQRSGQPMVVHTFIGSSPIRMWSEGWDLDFVCKMACSAIDFTVRQGLEVAFITEDTTRSSPEVLTPLFRAAIDHGATRLVLCDTVGHATSDGTRALVRWVRSLIAKTGAEVTIEWHGHDDRGLALTNALAAIESGADRVHACGLGLGERAGNTSTELL
ncbi:MAG TPA: 2-isopropylmalate synthase, partial [Polyangiaceae bacterium]|nr:2-isopropylmalate synthase [Polyangiaceae bacterium]